MVKTRKNIENMEIYDYMKELNEKMWGYFFEDSLAHATIFHSLNELEQIIISRLLFIQQAVSERAMRLWINPSFLKKLSECIKNLVEAKILIESETKKDNYNQYKLNDKFRHTLLNKIYKNNENNIFIFSNNVKEQIKRERDLYENNSFPSRDEISSYANAKWNNLLHFIASPRLSGGTVGSSNMGNTNNDYSNSNIAGENKVGPFYADRPIANSFKNEDTHRQAHLDRDPYYNTPVKKGHKKLQGKEEEEEYQPYEDEPYDDEPYEDERYGESVYGECREGRYSMGDYDEEGEEGEHGEETPEGTYDSYDYYQNENAEYAQYHDIESTGGKYGNTSIHKMTKDNTSKINLFRRRRTKKKGIYAYKQNDLYYKSLQNMENSYMEEENNNSFFYSNVKKDTFTAYTPSDSLIEVLKRKNFILDEVNNNKTINMSREAFSWFLKDIRSRIISLILEYLLIIDDGHVTHIAQEISTRYKRKGNIEGNITNISEVNHSMGSMGSVGIVSNPGTMGSTGNSFSAHDGREKRDIPKDSCYATTQNKDLQTSEIYVRETILLILSITQCDICHPIFLDNLTKAQREFIDFGIHIGLFFKSNERHVFTTPYALLLTINNLTVQNYISVLNNMSVEMLCDGGGNGCGDGNDGEQNEFRSNVKENLSEKYLHYYLLLSSQKYRMIDSASYQGDVKNMDKRKITLKLMNEGLYADKKINGNDNLEIGLIVQSNFKVYLYTSSILKINILSHLCELQARTPNMVVGILTRRSVLNAYNSDITANQIIKFLESYAHPGRSNFKSSIPINVITQLKLWESERHRLSLEDSIVFKAFEKEFLPHLYQQIVIWANSKNYLLHHTPWPKNPMSAEFDMWMKSEKYLCCIYESKNEIIDKIKEIREKLMKKRQKP
ncbi:RNA polymerase II transcription factor B subunit 2, putative [Plasmodium ovale]|uniref:General transcription factor IIH subunit 4 n=2 Tax=Plasmodium ovale TaxID=36330 RepID=A0A1A8X4B8_PLAOA|nr:RNA polymerase II transcription factor B subunit 2, putative (TFB2) [Plasmodium ovale curtisi]SBS98608.1 RNA polymerase II transcription factor B subunit 2, putative (TFB2) [Plasmodium ovale curtisi]SCQ17244.1 RNA polymerase II transcription factor B subunit 2, putative [Plasmodium ovale]